MTSKLRIFIVSLAALFVVAFAVFPASAEVDTYDNTPDQVLDDSDTNQTASPQTEVLDSTATLPVTGGDVLGLTTIGVLAIAAGGGLVLYRRRKTA